MSEPKHKDDCGTHEGYMCTCHWPEPKSVSVAPNVCPTCGCVYAYHVEHRMTCPNGHHWRAPWANTDVRVTHSAPTYASTLPETRGNR